MLLGAEIYAVLAPRRALCLITCGLGVFQTAEAPLLWLCVRACVCVCVRVCVRVCVCVCVCACV